MYLEFNKFKKTDKYVRMDIHKGVFELNNKAERDMFKINIPIVNKTSTDFELEPNVLNVYETAINTVTFTFKSGMYSDVQNAYNIVFTTGTTPNISFPQSVESSTIPTFSANKKYYIQIINDVVTIGGNIPVIDNIVTNNSNAALSAAQGLVLNTLISNMRNLGRYLALWDCSTGKPTTFPLVTPYTYLSGDYYRVGKISDTSTNYMPDGTQYTTGGISTKTATVTPKVGDIYFYDKKTWALMESKNGFTVQTSLPTGTNTMTVDTIYNLGDKSAAFDIKLPTSGTSEDKVIIHFKATAAITPTCSDTYYGETIFTTTANKIYKYIFTRINNVWVLSILEV